jgi:hypothetical protein
MELKFPVLLDHAHIEGRAGWAWEASEMCAYQADWALVVRASMLAVAPLVDPGALGMGTPYPSVGSHHVPCRWPSFAGVVVVRLLLLSLIPAFR